MSFNPPTSPLNYPANNGTPPRIFSYGRAPTSNDFQNFFIRDFWIDNSSDDLYFLVDKGAGSGTWILLGGTGGAAETLTGNTGGAVPPDVSNNINVIGASPITVAGDPGTNTLTIDTTGILASSYVTNSGTATPAADILNVLGGTSITTTGSGNTVTINASANLANTYTADTGSAVPSANNLNIFGGTSISTSASGSTITINAEGSLANTYTANSGTATPAANNLNILGSGSVFTTATGSTVTITSSPTGDSFNLGITYSSSTFSITSANGTALSSSNPGFIKLPSKSVPGTFVTITITANQSFIDATGASTIIGNLFGLTTSIAHPNDIPFYIYAVLNDSENDVAFMVSRFPLITTSPVSGKIGQSGSAIADTQGSFFSLKSITTTQWDQNPCIRIGSFRMTMNASDDWTVSALSNSDGIGKFQQDVRFLMTQGQFGAKANNYFIDNGGTAPNITSIDTSSLAYEIIEDQMSLDMAITFTSNGVGAVSLTAKSPFNCSIGGLVTSAPVMVTDVAFAPTWIGTTVVSTGSNNIEFYATNPTNIRKLLNTDALNTGNLYCRTFNPLQFS